MRATARVAPTQNTKTPVVTAKNRSDDTLFKKEGKAATRFILSHKKRKATVGCTLFFKEGGAKR